MNIGSMIAAADFGALRAFAAVAEAASFSRAAKQLGVSPSALSQTVRSLEDRLGVQLLQRTTRSVAATEAGTTLLRSIGPAMNELDQAFRGAQNHGDEITGLVRLHCVRLAARLHLERLLPRFAELHPGIVVDVMLDDRTVDLVDGGFDTAIRVGEVIDQDLIVRRLGPELRQVAVASTAYLTQHGVPATPHDLARHRCIRWRWPGQEVPYEWEFHRDGRWFSIKVDGPLIVNDRSFAAKLAEAGAGIAFVAEEAVAASLADGTLVAVLTDWCRPFPGFFLCYPRQRHMAPALRAFVDAIGTIS